MYVYMLVTTKGHIMSYLHTFLCKASRLIFQNSTPFMKKFLLLNTNPKLEQKVPVKVRSRYLKGPEINS